MWTDGQAVNSLPHPPFPPACPPLLQMASDPLMVPQIHLPRPPTHPPSLQMASDPLMVHKSIFLTRPPSLPSCR